MDEKRRNDQQFSLLNRAFLPVQIDRFGMFHAIKQLDGAVKVDIAGIFSQPEIFFAVAVVFVFHADHPIHTIACKFCRVNKDI